MLHPRGDARAAISRAQLWRAHEIASVQQGVTSRSANRATVDELGVAGGGVRSAPRRRYIFHADTSSVTHTMATAPYGRRRFVCSGSGFSPRRAAAAWRPRGAAPGATPSPRSDRRDRKSTRLNSSHTVISYAVFCLKKKNILLFRCGKPAAVNWKTPALYRSWN